MNSERTVLNLLNNTKLKSTANLAGVQQTLGENAIVVTFDRQGEILRANDVFCELIGYTQNELKSQSKSFFELSNISIEKDNTIWDHLAENKSWKDTVWQETKDGSKFQIEMMLVPFFTEENEIESVIAFGNKLATQSDVKKQLDKSDKIFEATFNQMAVGIAHVSLDGDWIRVNERLCEILGYSKKELTKTTFQDVTYAEDLNKDLENVDKMIAGEINTYTLQKRYIHKKGHIVWCNLTVSLIKNQFDEANFFINVIEDISQQKEAEFELINREIQFRQLAEGLPQMVWTCDADGQCDYLSPQWVEFTGIPEKEQLGSEWLNQVHPDDREPTVNAWETAFQNESVLDVEFRIRRVDGVYHWFTTRALPFRDSDNKIVKWFGTNTDIETTKQNENYLLESQNYLTNIIDSLFVYVFVMDREGNLLEANKSSLVTLSLEIEDVRGKKMWDCDWWSFNEEVKTKIEQACNMAKIGSYLRFDSQMKTNRDNILVDFMISPMDRTKEKPSKLIATAVDMRERSEYKKLKEYSLKLKNSNEELEQFAHIASHDLQEPLRMIASYTEMLGKRYSGELDERADRYIQYVLQGAWRMQELINDLLAFSRVGFSNDNFHQVDTNQVLQNTFTNLESSIEASGAEIITGKLPEVMSNPILLGQLFQNIVSNSIKFKSKDDLVIEISVEKNVNGWLFSVADNGIGIEEEYLERIFQMFSRLNERAKFEGSGIGLAISKKIVELHSGRIWAKSVVGEGTTVYFTIPKTKNKENEEKEEND